MASEAGRGLIRMAANYTRLFATLLLGLALVRLLLGTLGNDAYGLIAMLGAAAALSGSLRDVVRRSMIRELAVGYHADDAQLRAVYNTALLLSLVVGLITVAMFTALLLVLPYLEIPRALLPAARWFVVAKAVEMFFFIGLAAPFNMYVVSERMVSFNAWTIVWRLGYVVAALCLALAGDIESVARGIILYGWLSTAFVVLSLITASAWIMRLDPRLLPAPWYAGRQAARELLRIGGWNAGVQTAMNLHLRLGALIMNLAFGLFGNLIFSLTTVLTSYVRMIATGVTTGVDAVAGRLSASAGDDAVRRLMHHSTRLHGLVTFPAAVAVVILAEPLLRLWVGPRVEDPATTLPPTVTLIRILMVGMAMRSISDGWMAILYGAGHIRRYAPIVLAGGVINPLLAGFLLLCLPDPVRYTAVCWAFSAVMIVLHGAVLPWTGARALGMTAVQFVIPLWRPLLIAVGCAPVLWIAARDPGQQQPLRLAVASGAYGILYLGLSLAFVMDGGERQRFARAARRGLSRITAS